MEVQLINGTYFVDGVRLIPEKVILDLELPFERSVDQYAVKEWFNRRWSDSIYWCIGYLVVIFVGQVKDLSLQTL